jgi:MFS transporter, DHA3 family, macrolide efflux protein
MLSLLSIKDFRNLWLAQAISRIGDAFYFIGPLFVVKRLFNDDAMVGYVGAIEALPYLLLGPFAGAIADRMDRKKIMVLSDVISTIVLAVYLAYLYVIPGNPPRAPFYIFGFLLSVVRVFFMPARSASVPRVVPSEKLMEANSFSAMTEQISWLVGNMLTATFGILADKFGATTFLKVMILANAISFVASAHYLSLLPKIIPKREEGVEMTKMFADIGDGIKYAKTDKVIALSLLATFGLGLFMSPFFVVYLATNMAWFGNKAAPLAIIEGCFIVGMLVMNFVVPSLKIRRAGLIYGLGLAFAGLNVIFMGFSQFYTVYCFWNLLCGLAIGIVNVPMMTYQQMKVPDQFQGRVLSLSNLIWMSVQPLGMALGGTLLGIFGIVKMHLLMGLGFAATGATPLLSKEFRDAVIPDAETTDTLKPKDE